MEKKDLVKMAGVEVSLDFVNEIIDNLRITRHAVEEMRKRTSFVSLLVENNGKIDFIATKKRIRQAIKQYMVLAYVNTDGSVNVALSDYDYFVFEYCDIYQQWNLITWKEKSWYGITIWEKWEMAKRGYDRP